MDQVLPKLKKKAPRVYVQLGENGADLLGLIARQGTPQAARFRELLALGAAVEGLGLGLLSGGGVSKKVYVRNGDALVLLQSILSVYFNSALQSQDGVPTALAALPPVAIPQVAVSEVDVARASAPVPGTPIETAKDVAAATASGTLDDEGDFLPPDFARQMMRRA